MEKMVNKVELNGFAGINPEIINLKNDGKIARFSLATSESYKDKNGEWVKNTTWHSIVMWNTVAKQAEEKIKKGARVTIMGKIVYRKYTDKNGVKRISTEIVAGSFEIGTKEAA